MKYDKRGLTIIAIMLIVTICLGMKMKDVLLYTEHGVNCKTVRNLPYA